MQLPLAFAFALFATLAQAADYAACLPVKLTCSGFEPNWRAQVSGNGCCWR